MKKTLTWLLCIVLVLSLLGCGKQSETTTEEEKKETTTQVPSEASSEAPSTAAPTTAPATEAPTTAEPTTAEPTTAEPIPEEPTTENPQPAFDPEEAAAVFRDFMSNAADLIEDIADREKEEPRYLELTGKLDVEAALKIPPMQGMEQGLDTTVFLSGEALVEMNSLEALKVMVQYDTDANKLSAVFGDGSESENPDELMHGVNQIYIDFAEMRQYTYDSENERWEYADLGEEAFDLGSFDREDLEAVTLEEIFAEYTFREEDGRYYFDGKLNLRSEAMAGMTDELFSYLLILGLKEEDVQPRLSFVLDKDAHLTELSLTVPAFALDLSLLGVKGLSFSLDRCELKLEADHSERHVEVPEEVKKEAEPEREDIIVFGELKPGDVLFEDEVLRVLVGDKTEEHPGAYTLNLRLENMITTGITVTVSGILVNGYYCPSGILAKVEPGEYSDTNFLVIDTQELGIEDVPDEIILNFNYRYKAADGTDVRMPKEIRLYPTAKSEEEIEVPERRIGENEKVIAEDDKYSFIILGIEYDQEKQAYSIDCYMENRTEDTMLFSWDKTMQVNGTDFVQPEERNWLNRRLPGMSRSYAHVELDEAALEAAGIKSVDEIGFRMVIMDVEDPSDTPLVNESFTCPRVD